MYLCCCRWLAENPKGAVAVAAINALTTLIKNRQFNRTHLILIKWNSFFCNLVLCKCDLILTENSGASTIMELEILLKAAQEKLLDVNFEGQRSKVTILPPYTWVKSLISHSISLNMGPCSLSSLSPSFLSLSLRLFNSLLHVSSSNGTVSLSEQPLR
jgi:hypothetical protein